MVLVMEAAVVLMVRVLGMVVVRLGSSRLGRRKKKGAGRKTVKARARVLLRYCDYKFNPNMVSTVGVDNQFKDPGIRGKAYRLNIFDTAGQEKVYALSKSFYRGCHGVLLA
ncbi:hypothetical protein N657DRAFT_631480 [Parathielavia appendiculata]|uniref:Uncharacterized protein n=1 Tax=Parathielavia appendiculata TaxID=2587402 RepID=A0AAN6U775_9PEZI|nr:hypothetical protein N657DRAFT_631480 [Parathielavia appendiculata]